MRIPTKQIVIIVVLLLSFLLSPATLIAQTGTNNWSQLNGVTAGTKLSVKLKDGKKVEGTFTSVSDTGLTLTVKNAAKEIRREDVATVHAVVGKSIGKSTLIGLGVGAGVGAAIGLAGDASNDAGGFEGVDSGGCHYRDRRALRGNRRVRYRQDRKEASAALRIEVKTNGRKEAAWQLK